MIAALDSVIDAGLWSRGDLYLCSTPSKGNARGVLAVLDKGYLADAAIYIHPADFCTRKSIFLSCILVTISGL